MEYLKINSPRVKTWYDRLCKMKSLLDSNNNLSLSEITKKVKGSSQMYSILNSEGIIKKVNKGFIWNEKIPPTKTLTRALCNLHLKKIKEYNLRKLKEIDISQVKINKRTNSSSKVLRKIELSVWQNKLKERREKCGAKASVIAKQLGVSSPTYYRWERCAKVMPSEKMNIAETIIAKMENILETDTTLRGRPPKKEVPQNKKKPQLPIKRYELDLGDEKIYVHKKIYNHIEGIRTELNDMTNNNDRKAIILREKNEKIELLELTLYESLEYNKNLLSSKAILQEEKNQKIELLQLTLNECLASNKNLLKKLEEANSISHPNFCPFDKEINANTYFKDIIKDKFNEEPIPEPSYDIPSMNDKNNEEPIPEPSYEPPNISMEDYMSGANVEEKNDKKGSLLEDIYVLVYKSFIEKNCIDVKKLPREIVSKIRIIERYVSAYNKNPKNVSVSTITRWDIKICNTLADWKEQDCLTSEKCAEDSKSLRECSEIYGKPLSDLPQFKDKENITIEDIKQVFANPSKDKEVEEVSTLKEEEKIKNNKRFEFNILWGVFKITLN